MSKDKVWLVHVAGEGWTAAFAATPQAAARVVAEELVRAARLRVKPAPVGLVALLARTRRATTRRRLVQEAGDFHSPSHVKDLRREERKLREFIDYHRRVESYVASLVDATPPLSPSQIRRIAAILSPQLPEPPWQRGTAGERAQV